MPRTSILDPVEVSDSEEEEEHDSDDSENDSDDDEEDSEEEEPPPPLPPRLASLLPRPPYPLPANTALGDSGTATTSYVAAELDEDEELKGWNREEVDGLFCPICMEPWTSSGEHQPSCLSCGHLFGMSCIKKWLGQHKNSAKCPQCNKKCTLKDVRRIYGSRVVVVEEESQKRIRLLEAKCNSLQRKDEEWRKKEVDWRMKLLVWQKKESDWRQKFEELNERTSNLERSVEELGTKSFIPTAAAADGFYWHSAEGHKVGFNHTSVSFGSFSLQQELQLDGARYFDIDDAGQILLIARRSSQIGGSHVLTKMSLVSPHEQDDILLPLAIKTVRDLHFSQSGRLALLASKKLSAVSMDSNNIVINYDLPAPAWSCSWDINSSNYVYTGLQNGMVLVFDLRQTERPLESRTGLSSHPVHTIYSLLEDQSAHSETQKLLTASSIGLCEWNVGDANELPTMITETANQGVCISLAYCHSSGNIVATFRPKVEMPDDMSVSQVSQTPSFAGDHDVCGSRVLLKRVNSVYQHLGSNCASVPGIRLPKSTILGMGDSSFFACGSESTSSLALQELPSLKIIHCLQSTRPIRDVKYTTSMKPGLLCGLSGDRVQFFSQK